MRCQPDAAARPWPEADSRSEVAAAAPAAVMTAQTMATRLRLRARHRHLRPRAPAVLWPPAAAMPRASWVIVLLRGEQQRGGQAAQQLRWQQCRTGRNKNPGGHHGGRSDE